MAAVFHGLHHHGEGRLFSKPISVYLHLVNFDSCNEFSPFETERVFHYVINSTNSRYVHGEIFFMEYGRRPAFALRG
jgi:hypothetical protein